MSKSSALVQPHAAPAGQRHSPKPSATGTPPELNSSLPLRYGVALVSTALVVLLRELLTPVWDSKLPFLTLFPAVLISVWYGGLGPGLVTTALCATAAAYFWLAPFYSLAISDPADQIGLALAVLVMLLITWLTAARQRSENALRRVHEELEQRVQERNAALVQANAALQSEHALLTTTLEQLPVGVIIADAPSGETFLANAQAKQIWRYDALPSPSSSEITRYQGLYPDGRRYEGEDWPLQRALRTGETVTGEEIRFIRSDGASGVMESNATPVWAADSRITAAVVVFTDITARKETEEALRTLNAELDQRVQERTAALRESEVKLAMELADTTQLQQISSQLLQEENINALYEQILDAAITLLRAEMGSMQMLYPEKNHLRLLAWRGFAPASAEFWEWVRVDSGSTCGVALATGERVVVPDVETCEFMAGTDDLDFYRLSGIRAVQSTPLVSRSGRVVGMISTHWRAVHQPSARELRLLDVLARQAADLVERKEAEDALHESEERLRAALAEATAAREQYTYILENMTGGFTTFDAKWRITYVNAMTEQVTNRRREDMLGKIFWEEFPDSLGTTIEAEYRRAMAERIPVEFEARYAGWDRWFETKLYPLPNEGLSVFFNDVTARKQAEEALAQHTAELERTNADLRQVAYVSAHDLQEPVRQVGLYTQRLARRYRDALDAETQEAMDFILEGTTRMQAQFTDLMHYLGVDEHGHGITTTDCEGVFQRALGQVQESFTASGATVTHDPLPTIEANAVQLQLIFQELLDNALKFRNSAPPRVHVWAECEECGWRFAVRDNGIGIDPQWTGQLFGLFRRLHPRQQYPGTGMGLAICRKIVERHGGRIWVESQPGQGATFIFTISEKSSQ